MCSGTIKKPGDYIEFRNLNVDYHLFEILSDDDYQVLYESGNRIAILSRYFAGMAIIISCLGLFGLATFTAERRSKKIGIRKVPGSGEFGIIRLLSGDFTRLVVAAIVVENEKLAAKPRIHGAIRFTHTRKDDFRESVWVYELGGIL